LKQNLPDSAKFHLENAKTILKKFFGWKYKITFLTHFTILY
jgi:hypothetical protein